MSARDLAVLGIAQARQHETDVREDLGDHEGAIRAARSILALEIPTDEPLREAVRLDAAGRLAELLLAETRLDEADATLDAALAEVSARSYFEARLHVVRGRVLEARSQAVIEADPEAGRALLERALAEHERSIAINQEVLDQP